MPEYILIAGVNGAGKSTLYHLLDNLQDMPRINIDEMERVKNGGHGIPDKDIEKRYFESFSNLKHIMSDCNTIFFYDNTRSFNCFAVYKSDEGMTIYPDAPNWFQLVID